MPAMGARSFLRHQPAAVMRFKFDQRRMDRLVQSSRQLKKAIERAHMMMGRDAQRFAVKALNDELDPKRATVNMARRDRGLRVALRDPRQVRYSASGWTFGDDEVFERYRAARYWRTIETGEHAFTGLVRGWMLDANMRRTFSPRWQPQVRGRVQTGSERYRVRNQAEAAAARKGGFTLKTVGGRTHAVRPIFAENALISRRHTVTGKNGRPALARTGAPVKNWRSVPGSAAFTIMPNHDKGWWINVQHAPRAKRYMRRALGRIRNKGAARYYRAAFQEYGLVFDLAWAMTNKSQPKRLGRVGMRADAAGIGTNATWLRSNVDR